MGSTPGRTKIFSSSPKHPYNFWGPPSLFNVYQALLPRRLKQPGLKLTTVPNIVLSLRTTGTTPSASHMPSRQAKGQLQQHCSRNYKFFRFK